MSEQMPFKFTKADAVPVGAPGNEILPAINRVLCVCSVYHTFNGQQPNQFDLNYSAPIREPEQAYIRERVVQGDVTFPVTFDFLEGKCGTIIIHNTTGAGAFGVQPSLEQQQLIDGCVLRVTIGTGPVYLIRPGRFMTFEFDVPAPIVIRPSNHTERHLVKIIGLPR
jgi:hypothetical protein